MIRDWFTYCNAHTWASLLTASAMCLIIFLALLWFVHLIAPHPPHKNRKRTPL